MNENEFKLHAELEDTHWWFRARREIVIDRFLHLLEPNPKTHVVEIGCGTGGNLKELSRYYSVLGVDVSSVAVQYALGRVTGSVMSGDFREVLRQHWRMIDGALLADVLEHVDDDKAFLEDLIKALKPGAFLVITVPAFRFLWSRHDSVLGHRRRYQRSEFRLLWKQLPVKEHYCSHFNCLLFPLIAFAKLLARDREMQSSLKPVNKILNMVLFGVFRAEKHILRRLRFPFGVSLIAVLEKTGF